MKATDGQQLSLLATRTLKWVGIILILAALVDFTILLIPSGLPENAAGIDMIRWQLNLVTQIVDRGIIPMVGLALLITGLWMDNSLGLAPTTRRSIWQNLGFATLLLSCLLGLVFLLMVPLHLNNTRLASQQTLEQIAQEATQAEAQIESRLPAELERQRTQIGSILQNEQQLQQAIASGQVSGEQASLLQKFRQDPKALDEFLNKQATDAKGQLQTQIRTRRLAAENQTRMEALKSGVRTGFSSLLLAIGYSVIGWTGLKVLGGSKKSTVR